MADLKVKFATGEKGKIEEAKHPESWMQMISLLQVTPMNLHLLTKTEKQSF